MRPSTANFFIESAEHLQCRSCHTYVLCIFYEFDHHHLRNPISRIRGYSHINHYGGHGLFADLLGCDPSAIIQVGQRRSRCCGFQGGSGPSADSGRAGRARIGTESGCDSWYRCHHPPVFEFQADEGSRRSQTNPRGASQGSNGANRGGRTGGVGRGEAKENGAKRCWPRAGEEENTTSTSGIDPLSPG